MGDLILADFKSRTWHREASLEERAAALVEQFNRMADEGTEVICVPYQSHNEMILDRMRGVPANVEGPNLQEPGCPVNVPYGGEGIDGMYFPDNDPA